MENWLYKITDELLVLMLLSLILLTVKQFQLRGKKLRRREKINYEASKRMHHFKMN